MRTGMVMHEGEAGGALLALGVEIPGFRRDAIIPVVLLNHLDADARRGDHPRDIGSQLLAERVYLALFHQRRGLNDHFGREVIEHSAFVLLAPAAPIAALAPFTGHCPGRWFIS